MKNEVPKKAKRPAGPNLFALLKPYPYLVTALIVLTLLGNAVGLIAPKLVGWGIDSFSAGKNIQGIVVALIGVAIAVFVFLYFQGVASVYLAEMVGRDLRQRVAEKLSRQDYRYVQGVGSAKLLTNLTSDVDAVKTFVYQGVASTVSSIVLIIGASVLLISTDWKLALIVLLAVPVIGLAFYSIFSRISKLFIKAQESIDWLNKVINESILGSALVRILNTQSQEGERFLAANTEAKTIGFSILKLFASLIPLITFIANLVTVIILALGGHFVINGQMSLGDLSAFYNYVSILIFPIIILGFVSSIIAQASASYARITAVLDAPTKDETGELAATLRGEVSAKNLSLVSGEKTILKDVSFTAKAGSRVAIMGPTAAGKSQLLYILIGLLDPTSGTVEYDGRSIADYRKADLYRQIGFVFQDSIIFNLTLRENIAFSASATGENLDKAVATAELADFISTLPNGLDTVVSERGSSLSGGQKQRVMLARALVLNPKILILDDFTARLDGATEKKVMDNVRRNYPGITVITVTQKTASAEDCDQIVLLEEGEVLATGTHDELMKNSPEYVQINDSQKSTSRYELHAE